MALPGFGGIRTLKVAVLIVDGMDGMAARAIALSLIAAGAVPKLLGLRLGTFTAADGENVEADATLENSPAVLFDGLVLPDGKGAVQHLAKSGQALEFLKNQYRHCKTILVPPAARELLAKADIPVTLPSGHSDPGLILGASGDKATTQFIAALAKQRHLERDQDPPPV